MLLFLWAQKLCVDKILSVRVTSCQDIDSYNIYFKVPDAVLAAVVSNKPSVVSKWLNDLPLIDENVLQALKQILLCSVKLLSVDVVKLFQPPSKWSLVVYIIS